MNTLNNTHANTSNLAGICEHGAWQLIVRVDPDTGAAHTDSRAPHDTAGNPAWVELDTGIEYDSAQAAALDELLEAARDKCAAADGDETEIARVVRDVLLDFFRDAVDEECEISYSDVRWQLDVAFHL